MPTSVRLAPDVESRLERLAEATGRTKAFYLRELIEQANLAKLWGYRVGDHRVICQIEDARFLVLVVRIAHRSATYD
jgi:Cytotoxic translational repressor of toxin-antitoxin stability system